MAIVPVDVLEKLENDKEIWNYRIRFNGCIRRRRYYMMGDVLESNEQANLKMMKRKKN
jgi:hypothetical protein